MDKREDLVSAYFGAGLRQSEILATLVSCHNIHISKRQLQRDLRQLGHFRRCNYSDIGEMASFITEQLETSGSRLGYRLMHLRCIDAGFIIRRLLYILDPLGVQSRMRHRLCRRQYTYFIWHVDGYDKLKPYGLCINACIDDQ